MHREMLAAMGIDAANCSSCAYLGSEDDGGEPEYSISWPTCNKVERYQHLTSFPFKKEMKCWRPEFWHSKFADMVNGSDESMSAAVKAYRAAENSVEQALLQIAAKKG